MGRLGISSSDVVRAYVALIKQRREPTLLNLRLELGSGSYSTIAEHLERLRLVRRSTRYARPQKRGRPRRRTTAAD